MHQRLQRPRQEAVRDENILLEAELPVEAFEVAGAVVLDAMAQHQILRASRRPDRVGLHKAQPLKGAFQSCGREEGAGNSKAPQVGEGDHQGQTIIFRPDKQGNPIQLWQPVGRDALRE